MTERDEQTRKLIGLLVGLRKESDVSKAELRRRSGLSAKIVKQIESANGDPHLSSLHRYAHALGVAVRIEVREPD